ncbi:hypothetical protein [Archangium primigenium]|uniref:hypothetical protein n=1 Tax=[Archangium] primigenium TaxID=2792470 RepID=UPI001958548A|nr:hypothetical protein [Archangium primigenium]MBM7116420.1 hypothetical protein [Archangium primigenium]
MKNTRLMIVGAAAAALLLGATGCRSDQPRDAQRENVQDLQGTGGSGLESTSGTMAPSTVPPSQDSLRGLPGQDSDVHHRDLSGTSAMGSPMHGSSSQQGLGGAGTTSETTAHQEEMNTGSTTDYGTGGSGTKVDSSSGMNRDTTDSETGQARDLRYRDGMWNNEAGSRTNATGSNISTDTNPTEPRNKAKSQVPGPRDQTNR